MIFILFDYFDIIDINDNPEVLAIDGNHTRATSEDEDENRVFNNALEAPEGINENNGPFDECPNNSVPVLNDNPEAPLIGGVQFPVLPVANDENEVTDGRPTFTLGDEREVPVIDDGNECSNATGIQPNENEPDQSGANEPPAIGNVENGLVDQDIVLDFSVLDADLPSERPPIWARFSDLVSVDLVNVFNGYLKITGGITDKRSMSITIEKEIEKEMSLSVVKYDPGLVVSFINRKPCSRPCEKFEDSHGNKFTSTVLEIRAPADAVSTLLNYKKEKNEFGMMLLKLRVGEEVKLGYIRFDWDPINSKTIVPSFYNY
ncbi:unnamed protein product, partial [Mesorhabditis belari]|uniref:Uncharacterized protein n=1 Tax=Mesorhabditis belari TaxID=2138241 RepID=A0AAF3EJY8_9BILA